MYIIFRTQAIESGGHIFLLPFRRHVAHRYFAICRFASVRQIAPRIEVLMLIFPFVISHEDKMTLGCKALRTFVFFQR